MTEAQQQSQALERRSHELSVVHDVAQALNASVDLSSLLETALEKVAALLGLDTGWVLLFDEATGEPYAAASQNLPPGLCEEPERMRGWCYCLKSLMAGTLPEAANVGIVKCSRLRELHMAKGDTAGLRYHASIPLKVYDSDSGGDGESVNIKRLGMLNVASPEWREITEDELDILRTIGGLLGVAIERAQLHARMLDAVQTEERLRMAREIHDTIAQDFAAIAFQLDTAEVLLEQASNPDQVIQRIQAARKLADKGLRDARRSVYDLRAAPLEGRTLPEALAALAEESATEDGPTIELAEAPSIGSIPPATEVGLYRIGQEALQNALRHASADHVTIHLGRTGDAVRLIIEDDGQGFDSDAALGAGGNARRFGLVGMRERARLLGGTLHIESTVGVGTRIVAEVPLSAELES